MWIFTKYGAYSVVCAKQGEGEPGQPIDLDRVMVRARVCQHLEILKERFAAELGNCSIKTYAKSDYRHRIFVDKVVWAKVVSCLVMETDYGNFKKTAADFQGNTGSDYLHALHNIWGTMYDLQGKAEKKQAAGSSKTEIPSSPGDVEVSGTLEAVEFMLERSISPADKPTSPEFVFDLGAKLTSGLGKPRTIVGYGVKASGKAVYIVTMPESSSLAAKTAAKANEEYHDFTGVDSEVKADLIFRPRPE